MLLVRSLYITYCTVHLNNLTEKYSRKNGSMQKPHDGQHSLIRIMDTMTPLRIIDPLKTPSTSWVGVPGKRYIENTINPWVDFGATSLRLSTGSVVPGQVVTAALVKVGICKKNWKTLRLTKWRERWDKRRWLCQMAFCFKHALTIAFNSIESLDHWSLVSWSLA